MTNYSFSLQTILAGRTTSIYVGPNLKSHLRHNPEKPGALHISSIVVVGNATPDGQFFHFHLSMVAQGEDPSDSISLNMIPTYDGNRMYGILEVEYRGELSRVLPDAITFEVALPASKVTAATLCRCLLTTHHLDRYECVSVTLPLRFSFTHSFERFNLDGQGCRHWCATALENLAETGFIDVDVGKKFQEFEEDEARKWGTKFPMPRIKGTFHNDDAQKGCKWQMNCGTNYVNNT